MDTRKSSNVVEGSEESGNENAGTEFRRLEPRRVCTRSAYPYLIVSFAICRVFLSRRFGNTITAKTGRYASWILEAGE